MLLGGMDNLNNILAEVTLYSETGFIAETATLNTGRTGAACGSALIVGVNVVNVLLVVAGGTGPGWERLDTVEVMNQSGWVLAGGATLPQAIAFARMSRLGSALVLSGGWDGTKLHTGQYKYY